MPELPRAMAAHLAAVTGDAERLRDVWAPDGVLEFPYAPSTMPGRFEGVEALVDWFGGSKRWGDWTFTPVRVLASEDGLLHVAEVHATATVLATGGRYVQDYVIWMDTDTEGRITRWREYWDLGRL